MGNADVNLRRVERIGFHHSDTITQNMEARRAGGGSPPPGFSADMYRIRVPSSTSELYCLPSTPNSLITSATRWIFCAFTGPVGNPGSAMTTVTRLGKSSAFAMAARTTGGSVAAIVWPSSIARTKAAAVFGCFSAHAWVATYPSMGRFSVAA